MYLYFYQVLMVFSLVISAFTIVLTWRRRFLPAAPAMIALMSAVFVWTLGFYMEAGSRTLGSQLLFTRIGYLGSMTVPVAWFIFANNYTNTIKFMRGWRIISACVFPVIITALIWTNDWHHLMWSNPHLVESGPFTVTAKTYGPFFWAALAYNYLLVAGGGVILLRRLFVGTPLYAKQAVALIIGVSLPWIWNIIYVFDLVPLPRKDLTPAMFAISGIAITMGLLRYHLFTTIPFAREYIVKQLPDAVFIFDTRNCLAEANPAALAMAGLGQEIIGKKLEELQPMAPLFQHIRIDGPAQAEFQIETATGKRILEQETTVMTIDRGEEAGRLVILRDITEQHRSEEQYRLVTENSADIIYKLNLQDNRYTYISPSIEKVLGYTEKEALAVPVGNSLTPESFEKQRTQTKMDIQNGVTQRILELDSIHKDGHIVPMEVHGRFIQDANGIPVEIVGVARDITQRKQMERQLMMQDRLASIGQLTSAVAHELNNPLTSIINYAALLMKRDLPEDIKQDVEEIYGEAQRTAFIVKNLLTFTRKQEAKKEPANLIEAVQKVQVLRNYEQRVNNIYVNIHAEPELPPVSANVSQLQQVFFNIIINAEYFMLQAHKRGTLLIRAEAAGDKVSLRFTDDGPGIPQENLKPIFTPLFSTKEPGKGTGLSLSICQSIINEHGGSIRVESEAGKGASFIIELPVYRAAEE